MDLRGKTALITGASRGIGRAVASAMAAAGADVIGLARSERDLLDLGDEISRMDRSFKPLVADVADAPAIEACAREAWEWSGSIDILVNAAGTIVRSDPPDVVLADWDKTFDVNVRGLFFLTQAVGTRMYIAENGSIISICSLAAEVVTGASVVYQASKAALVQLTRALAVRWAPHVRVNAVGPGYIRTSLNQDWLAAAENLAQVESRTPLGRVGLPEDVSGAVVFLASDQASFITGQHLLIDGGWSAT